MSDKSENTTAYITGYEAAKRANARLSDEGLPAIPPQMMYNYTSAKLRAGKKPLIECDEHGIRTEAFEAWLERYVSKKLAAVTAE